MEYNGILPISCDGAIAQVEWSGGPNGAMTKASINTEFSLVVPSYQQRREISRVRFQVHLNALAHGHSRRLRKQGVVVL